MRSYVTQVAMALATAALLLVSQPGYAMSCSEGDCPPEGVCEFQDCHEVGNCRYCFYECPGEQGCLFKQCEGQGSETTCDE